MTPVIETLGKYQLLEELGRGGFASVYRARDTTLDREVALKVLHAQLLVDPSFVSRFQREARAVANLRHPHIVTVYEVGSADGRLFISMELAHGSDLGRAIAERGRIPWPEALALLRPVCEALEYAHGQKVVHRDLKPANILIDPEHGPLLSDFGFARLMGGSSQSLSLSGGILGTPAYIAPEVWELDAATPAADLYALGCIVFELLTGQALFTGATPMQAMRSHDRGPQLPQAWPEGVPAGVGEVLRRALAKEPDDRYPSAVALWHALNDLEAQAQATREAAERAAVAAQWRAEAESAMAAGELTAARMAAGRWLAAAPEDGEAKAFLERVREAEGAKLREARQGAEDSGPRQDAEDSGPRKTRKDAEDAERGAAEEKARREAARAAAAQKAEEKARLQAEEKARRDAEAQARREAKEQARREAEASRRRKPGGKAPKEPEMPAGKHRRLPRWARIAGFALLVVVALAALVGAGFAVVLLIASRNQAANPAPTWTPTPRRTEATPTSAPPALAGHIAFASDRDGDHEIYVMDADGSRIAQLTDNSFDDGSPCWSSDGSRIAFVSDRDGNQELYAMDADGTDVVRLTTNKADDLDPQWSPDGKHIAFVSNRNNTDGYWEIFMVAVADHTVTRLTNWAYWDSSPTWSPDGQKVAFEHELVNYSGMQIYQVDVNTKRMSFLANVPSSPAWSPDGAYLAFSGVWEKDSSNIGIVDLATGQATRLTYAAVKQHAPAWSPDGKNMAFWAGQYPDRDIYVMGRDGSGLVNVTNSPADDLSPNWGP